MTQIAGYESVRSERIVRGRMQQIVVQLLVSFEL